MSITKHCPSQSASKGLQDRWVRLARIGSCGGSAGAQAVPRSESHPCTAIIDCAADATIFGG